ncbi:hypothetical protein GW17_00023628 [Ensete ventricosum]|nr:hypothetical protein GW17_00023628 [Ensete ventricosum]RZR88048.1 hypothetical protein BHM03_00015553 [Ensete ventricosum]
MLNMTNAQMCSGSVTVDFDRYRVCSSYRPVQGGPHTGKLSDRYVPPIPGGTGFTSQVVELDFLYPSEGIHRRWDGGYRITSMAATWDQAALVLSVPKRKPGDETQETLRTSSFPSAHVKDKWAKNLYLASICYGRTVS